MKKLLSLTAAAVLSVSMCCATACGGVAGGGGGGQDVDSSKSQLNVGIFDAGLGTVWLDEAIKDFEAYYANTPFEEGKMGVEVIKDAKKSEFRPGNLLSTMEYYDNAMYFLDQSRYVEYVSQGLVADITDTIKEKIYDEDGNFAAVTGKPAVKSILDTMQDDVWDVAGLVNGKYYAIPYYTGVSGMIYDADLFNEKGYYYFANGQIGAKQADIDSGNCGTGPDGVLGTTDDGLPYTWNDFIKLMNLMVTEDIIPFTWAGATNYQRQAMYQQIWANYEGTNNYSLNFTFKGTDSVLGEINDDNANILKNQEGRVAGIKACYDVIKNSKYYSTNAINNQSHTEAEFEYIDSINTNKRIAMFLEGGYWESEARAVFDDAAITNPEHGYGKRDFRLMAVPNFIGTDGVKDQTVKAGDKEVLIGGTDGRYDAIVCISAKNTCENPELQMKLAKLFLQFVQSREQLAQFTQHTGACFRPYEFKTMPEELEQYTKFGQNIYKYIQEGAKIVNADPTSAKILASQTNYQRDWFFGARIGNDAIAGEPMGFFLKYNDKNVSDAVALMKAAVDNWS